MGSATIFVFSLCVVAAIAVQTSLPSDVAAGFYPGRSAPIVLKSNTNAERDASVMFLDPSEHSYFTAGLALPALSPQNLADVTLRSVGLAPVSHEWSSSSFVKNDYFDRARASVSLLVDSLGDDVVNQYKLANLQKWRAQETSAAITSASFPTNSLSLSASIASGVSPSSHGIVARSWSSRGQVVRAYSGPASHAQSPNVADILAASFDFAQAGSLEGKPLTMSVSSDAQLSSAQCAHSTSWSSKTDNNYCLGAVSGSYKLLSSVERPLSSVLSFTDAELITALTAKASVFAKLTGAVTATVSSQGVRVAYPGGEALLSLNVPEQRAVLVELQYALSLADSLSTERSLAALARDDAPDFYAITFASLTPLIERFGRQSPAFVAALHLIDATLPTIMTRFSAAYGDRAVFQVVLLGTHDSIRGVADNRAILSQVSSVIGDAAEHAEVFFPYVYVTMQSAAELVSTCARLNDAVESLDFSVYCPAPESAAHYREFMRLSSFVTLSSDYSSSNSSNNTVTSTDIELYQITLWFVITFVFVLAGTVWGIMYMDIKRDSLVYGQFNPMWEDRKRGK